MNRQEERGINPVLTLVLCRESLLTRNECPAQHLPPRFALLKGSFSSFSYPQYSGVILPVYSVNLPLYAFPLPRLSTCLSTSDTSPSIHHSIYTGIVVLYKLLVGKIYAPSYSDIRTYRTAPELNQKQEVRQAPASRPAAQSKAGREAGAGAISPCAEAEGCREAATVPGQKHRSRG